MRSCLLNLKYMKSKNNWIWWFHPLHVPNELEEQMEISENLKESIIYKIIKYFKYKISQ